jgi:hypothetical protein
MFQLDTFLLALPVSWGYQTQREYCNKITTEENFKDVDGTPYLIICAYAPHH